MVAFAPFILAGGTKSLQKPATSQASQALTLELTKIWRGFRCAKFKMKDMPKRETESCTIDIGRLDNLLLRVAGRPRRGWSSLGWTGEDWLPARLTLTPHMRRRTITKDDYYGRGRVCMKAASSRGSYVSNIVSLPGKAG